MRATLRYRLPIDCIPDRFEHGQIDRCAAIRQYAEARAGVPDGSGIPLSLRRCAGYSRDRLGRSPAPILEFRNSSRTGEARVNLHEYQAKKLFADYGMPVSAGIAADTADDAVEAARRIGGSRWVCKVQVHAGGRGKAGGVKVVGSLDGVRGFAENRSTR